MGMTKEELLRVLQTEIRRHSFDTFVYNPPSIVEGGNGVVVPGCPACRKRLFTMPQFMDHLADDVLPQLFNRVSNRHAAEVGDGSSTKTASKVSGN